MNQTPVFPVPLLERVREGMTVIDDSGRQLGTVAHIRMGDPQAVTTEGQDTLTSDAAVVAAPAASPGGTSAFGAAVRSRFKDWPASTSRINYKGSCYEPAFLKWMGTSSREPSVSWRAIASPTSQRIRCASAGPYRPRARLRDSRDFVRPR